MGGGLREITENKLFAYQSPVDKIQIFVSVDLLNIFIFTFLKAGELYLKKKWVLLCHPWAIQKKLRWQIKCHPKHDCRHYDHSVYIHSITYMI